MLLSQQQKSGSYPSPPPAVRSQLRLIEYETIGASKHLGLIALCKLAVTAAAVILLDPNPPHCKKGAQSRTTVKTIIKGHVLNVC